MTSYDDMWEYSDYSITPEQRKRYHRRLKIGCFGFLILTILLIIIF